MATKKTFRICYFREKAERKKLQKDLELEHTLRIRLENINYELVQVLKIIKKKKVDMRELLKCDSHKEYNSFVHSVPNCLSGIEFKLLKRYFK